MKELLEIQTRISVKKDRENKFGKYMYWKVDDIIQAALPILKEQKCTITLSDELVEFMARPFVKATATLTNVENGDSVSTTAFAELCAHAGMSADQCTGSASTYARKYALCGLFAINDDQDTEATKDPDELDNRPAKPAKKAAPKPEPKPEPKPAPKAPIKPDKKMYESLVNNQINGILTKGNEEPRVWYVRKCQPTDNELHVFDVNVKKGLIQLAVENRNTSSGITARERFAAIFGGDKKSLDAFDTAVAMERHPAPEPDEGALAPNKAFDSSDDDEDLPF